MKSGSSVSAIMQRLATILRGFAYVWFLLFAATVLLSCVGAVLTEGLWGGVVQIATWWNPLNVSNYLVVSVVISPGIGALAVANRINPGSRRQEALRLVREAAEAFRDLDDDRKVVEAFGAVLEATIEARQRDFQAASARMSSALSSKDGTEMQVAARSLAGVVKSLRPESELPYPIARIRKALQNVLAVTDDPKVCNALNIGLIHLNEWVPERELPTAPVKRFAE